MQYQSSEKFETSFHQQNLWNDPATPKAAEMGSGEKQAAERDGNDLTSGQLEELGWLLPMNKPASTRSHDEANDKVEFSPEEIVRLHWLLLSQIKMLADPEAPLDEKFELVRWIFTDKERDERPFSFVNCLRVVGCSPHADLPFLGKLDAQEIRDSISMNLKRWFLESLDRLPDHIRMIVITAPEWVSDRLYYRPQWLNQQVRQCNKHRSGNTMDLFDQ